MPDIPDNLIAGGREYLVKRYRELHHAEVRSKVPAGAGYPLYYRLAQFLCKRLKLLLIKAFDVRGGFYVFKNASSNEKKALLPPFSRTRDIG